MEENRIEKYLFNRKVFNIDPVGFAIGLNACLELGVPLKESFERRCKYEKDEHTHRVLSSAIQDIEKNEDFYIIMIKTGFFCNRVENIFLMVQDPQKSLKAVVEFYEIINRK